MVWRAPVLALTLGAFTAYKPLDSWAQVLGSILADDQKHTRGFGRTLGQCLHALRFASPWLAMSLTLAFPLRLRAVRQVRSCNALFSQPTLLTEQDPPGGGVIVDRRRLGTGERPTMFSRTSSRHSQSYGHNTRNRLQLFLGSWVLELLVVFLFFFFSLGVVTSAEPQVLLSPLVSALSACSAQSNLIAIDEPCRKEGTCSDRPASSPRRLRQWTSPRPGPRSVLAGPGSLAFPCLPLPGAGNGQAIRETDIHLPPSTYTRHLLQAWQIQQAPSLLTCLSVPVSRLVLQHLSPSSSNHLTCISKPPNSTLPSILPSTLTSSLSYAHTHSLSFSFTSKSSLETTSDGHAKDILTRSSPSFFFLSLFD